ncbi:maleylpyruvate isomerase family mycothiol-dependent enzyme [Agrococcus terreus]|uniref:maleylpyruvate isomerase family mycothiol-dependent enzyme n=1 Tax=Agrococcus terreus TaxID=574649 RepID=UPI00384C99C1
MTTVAERLDGRDRLARLAQLQGEFLASAERADPATKVPSCGRWDVRQLVVHLSRIHHWAAAQAARRQEVPLGRGPFDLPALYAECAAELRDALATLDPDARAWTLIDDGVRKAEQTGAVRFWHRRQLLETLVHLWDLRTATGEGYLGDDDDWLDCLDEVVGTMHPRQVRLGRVPAPAARIVLAPDGVDGRWMLAGAPADAPEAVVRGPVRSLALLVWGRAGLDDGGIRVEGDRALAAAELAPGLTP